MAIQIVMEVRTSPKTNVRPKVELVLAIYSHVTTATVFHEFTFVMATMIVWIILTKMKTGNVRPANAILTLSMLLILKFKFNKKNIFPRFKKDLKKINFFAKDFFWNFWSIRFQIFFLHKNFQNFQIYLWCQSPMGPSYLH